MGHIKELLVDAAGIGEVITDIGDYRAHDRLRNAARESGVPIQSITRLALGELASTTDIDTVARQLAPGLARWMVRNKVTTVVSQGHLSADLRHRVAGRASVLAAMQAATIRQEKISVLVGHGEDTVSGPWTFDSPFDGTEPAAADGPERLRATSYSRVGVNPGLSSGGSVEHHFGMSSD